MGRSRRRNKIRNKTRNKKNIMKGGTQTRLDLIETRLDRIEHTLKKNTFAMNFLGEQSARHGQMQGQEGSSL